MHSLSHVQRKVSLAGLTFVEGVGFEAVRSRNERMGHRMDGTQSGPTERSHRAVTHCAQRKLLPFREQFEEILSYLLQELRPRDAPKRYSVAPPVHLVDLRVLPAEPGLHGATPLPRPRTTSRAHRVYFFGFSGSRVILGCHKM